MAGLGAEPEISIASSEGLPLPGEHRHLGSRTRREMKGGRFPEVLERADLLAVHWPALRRRLPGACFPEAADDEATYHPYRYHHPLELGELAGGLEAAGLEVRGATRFLWVLKTLPDPLLAAGRAAERLAESPPPVPPLRAPPPGGAGGPGTTPLSSPLAPTETPVCAP